MSDVSLLPAISGLSFDSTLLTPLLFFCIHLLLFLSCLSAAYRPILLIFFKKNLPFVCLFRSQIGFLMWLLFCTGICHNVFPFFLSIILL